MDVLSSTRHLCLISLLSLRIEACRLLNYLSIQCHLFAPQLGVTRPWNQSHLKWISETLIKNAALLWKGVREEGWSSLIWLCFQTTWCIRTIKISTSHSLIAWWVSADGLELGFWVSCGSADTLRAGYFFWPAAMSEKTMFLSSVSGLTEQGQRKCSRTNEKSPISNMYFWRGKDIGDMRHFSLFCLTFILPGDSTESQFSFTMMTWSEAATRQTRHGIWASYWL